MNNLGWIIAIVLVIIILMMWSGRTPAAVQRIAEDDDPNYVCDMEDSQGRRIRITSDSAGPEFANLCRQQERRPMYFWSYPYPFFIIRRRPPPPPPPMP